jgi:hypothetical protein
MSRGGRVIQICRHGIEAGKSMKIGEYQNYRFGWFPADSKPTQTASLFDPK